MLLLRHGQLLLRGDAPLLLTFLLAAVLEKLVGLGHVLVDV